MNRRTLLKRFGYTALGSTLLAGYAIGGEPLLMTRTTRYAFTPPRWTPGLKLRVALIADIHACKPWMSGERIAGIVERTNALEPDLTLLLGDYSAGMNFVFDYVHSSEWAPILGRLRARHGVYAVLGNHDWWEDKTAQRNGHGPTFGQLALEANGIPVLENKALRLAKGGLPFWVAGLGDQIAFLPSRSTRPVGAGRTTLRALWRRSRMTHRCC